MALELCQEDEWVETRSGRKPFFSDKDGPLNQLFLEFRKERALVFPLAALLERRAHSSAPGWLRNYHSCTSIVYPAQGAYDENHRRFKVHPVSDLLLALDTQSPLTQGALSLQSYEYRGGQEFLRREVILERDLTAEEAKEHPVLLSFCNGDNNLLQAIVERDFSEARRRGFGNKRMGVFLADELSVASERASCAGWPEYFSRFYGGSDLGGVGGGRRLVGVVPEAVNEIREKNPRLYLLVDPVFDVLSRIRKLEGIESHRTQKGKNTSDASKKFLETTGRDPRAIELAPDGVVYHERQAVLEAFEKSIETLPDAQKEIARRGFQYSLPQV